MIRLAEQLERSRDRSVADVELEQDDGRVILRAVASGEPGSDPSVALWSAQRNADILAAAIGRPVEVVGVGG